MAAIHEIALFKESDQPLDLIIYSADTNVWLGGSWVAADFSRVIDFPHGLIAAGQKEETSIYIYKEALDEIETQKGRLVFSLWDNIPSSTAKRLATAEVATPYKLPLKSDLAFLAQQFVSGGTQQVQTTVVEPIIETGQAVIETGGAIVKGATDTAKYLPLIIAGAAIFAIFMFLRK